MQKKSAKRHKRDSESDDIDYDDEEDGEEDGDASMDFEEVKRRFKKDEDRANLLAYLATLSDAPVPFPAP